jgi:hypothetical protein
MLTFLLLLGVPIWQAAPYSIAFYLALFAMWGASR